MSSSPQITAGETVCEHLGLDSLLELRATGTTVRKLCADLAIPVRGLYRYLNRLPERRAAWNEVGRELADRLVTEAREIVDDVPLERSAINRARAQADHRRWEAAFRDPERWGRAGEEAKPNLGDLHLAALRAVHPQSAAPVVREYWPSQTTPPDLVVSVPAT